MNIFCKITSILLLPVILLSFTGASLHVHYCEHSGKTYTDVHFANLAHSSDETGCCQQHLGEESCSSDSCETNGYQHDESCCLDFQNEFTTDKNYNPSSHSINISPVIITLQDVPSEGTSRLALQTLSCVPEFRISWTPTPMQSMTVLIL